LSKCSVNDFVEIGDKCRIVLDGKTGIRERTLIISAKYIKRWIEAHPFRNQSDKPLFISTSHSRFQKRITDWTLLHIVRNACKKAGITKNVTPYTFRHSRATNLAPYMTEMELRHYFGWTKDSTMPGTYIHLSGKHIDDKYENIATGKKTKLEPVPSVLLPEECPNCNESVESTTIYCYKCGYPLRKKTVEKELEIIEVFQSPYVRKVLGIDVESILAEYSDFRKLTHEMTAFYRAFSGSNRIYTSELRRRLDWTKERFNRLMQYLLETNIVIFKKEGLVEIQTYYDSNGNEKSVFDNFLRFQEIYLVNK